MCGEELEEIESDVLRAASSGDVAGFHGYLSERDANPDGSGLIELVATLRCCMNFVDDGYPRTRWR